MAEKGKANELTYDDFLDRLSIQGSAGGRRLSSEQEGWLALSGRMCVLTARGRRVRGDKFIVTQNGKVLLQPPQQKVYNVISFIKGAS